MSSPRVTFYDAEPARRGDIIAKLAEAAWHKHKKLVVHTGDPEASRALDDFLWTYREESFLPHEAVRPGAQPEDAAARVVIVEGEDDPIGADILICDGPTSFEFAERFAVVIDFVDHRSPEQLQASRERYKAWTDRGVKVGHKRQ